MGGKGEVADGDSSHEENVALGESKHVFLHFGRGGLALLPLRLLKAQNLIDWGHYAAEDVVFGDDIGECSICVDDDKLMHVFIVPNDLVHSVCH